MAETSSDLCEVSCIHEDRVQAVRGRMQSDEVIVRLADVFKILADPTRVKIVLALSHQELCVCDLANLLGVSESAVSHQLRLLRSFRVVKYRKEGRMVYNSLDDEHVETLLIQVLTHIEHTEQ